ncbi:MAG: DNA primase [Francisella sp.]|jgi:DNA primase
MTKRISNSFIKELVASADIVDVVSRFVNIKKSGKNFKGCCPFHNEKSPSFFVTPDKNFFHCFGCQESGDSLTFVKKINNLEFIDAVKNLAEIVGKPVEYENYSQEDIQKEQLYSKCISFMETAQKYYRWNLGKSETKERAIEYLKKRSVNSELAKSFGIGYSSDGWNNITHLAKNAQVPETILVETGLAIKNDKGNVYDRFRGRIMFPIRNIQGNVIAYGGRVIEGQEDGMEGVKYINSPETMIFQKNNTLYGLYEYRQIKKQQEVSNTLVVVEGYMDVVGLASRGFYGAIATLGTAFSQNHAKILFRETSSVVLCFDGDSAGQKAAIRTIKIVLPILDANKKLKILSLADNKDPDDYIKESGLEAFQKSIDNALPVAEFLMQSFICDKDLTKAESKAEVLENLKTFLQEVEDNIYSESIVATIAEKINIKVEQIKNLLKSRKKFVGQTNEQEMYKPQIRQKRLSNNLLLSETLLAKLFANIQNIRDISKDNDFQIYPVSQRLNILAKSLKILKEDASNDMQTVILIQLLCEEFADCREYFFQLLSYGIKKSTKEYDSDLFLKDLRRVEKDSKKEYIKYLSKLPLRTEIEEMEYKYLLAKMSN